MADRESKRIVNVDVDYRRLAVAVAVAALILWFALVNTHSVTITWWFVDLETSLIIVIIVAALLGAIADRLAIYRRSRQQR